MRKLLALLIFVAAFVIGLYAVGKLDPYRAIPQVTLSSLNAIETAWYGEGLSDYSLRVQVEFSLEKRLYEVFVRGNALVEARSAEWDKALDDWGPLRQAGEEEAGFFTIPGLFGLVRGSLLDKDVEREVLRMQSDSDLSFPARIFLGRILEDGVPVDGTELLIEVLDFNRLSP